ncbi:MAG TPA: DUF3833 family protein, partial [Allosphingosinicella sp.]|nr:DUF3833 family protein [Allosphingosinicella sp.]
GVVKAMISPASRLEVVGQGRLEPDGTLVLDQVIQRQGAKPEQRQWRIRQVAPGSYRGTLTTAEGPVIGRADGNRLHLRYRLKDGGLEARQWIYLQPDGRTAVNRLRLSKFGMPVAAVEETIRKLD